MNFVNYVKKKLAYLSLAAILIISFPCAGQLVSSIQQANTAIQNAQPGAIIILKNGIYSGKINFNNQNGVDGAPITLQAQTPNGVVLTGSSWVNMTGKYLILKDIVFNKARNPNAAGQPSNILVYLNSAHHSSVKNCVFNRCGNPNDNNGTIVYMATGSYSNTIENCFFTRNYSISVKVEVNDTEGENNNNNTISRNYFKDIIDWPLNGDPDFNGGEPIAIGTGEGSWKTVSTVVEFNLFENTILDSEIISNKSSGNKIRYNTLRNNHSPWQDPNNDHSAHLSIRGGNSCEIYGNFIFDTDYGIVLHGNNHKVYNNYIENSIIGLRIRGGNSGYSNFTNSWVYNNTIVNADFRGIDFGYHAFSEKPFGNNFYNNIINTATSGVTANRDGNNASAEATYIIQNNNWGNNFRHGTTSHGNVGGVMTYNDPGLVKQGELFRLQSSSAAINAGNPIAGFNEDMDGQIRVSSPDIGADEFATTPIVRKPLKPSDVGPSWITDYDTYIVGNVSPVLMAQKVVQGDFDNDCRLDDIAVIYDYNGQTAIHLLKSNGSKFKYEPFWWDSPTASGNPISWFNFNSIRYVTSGDYDNDGFKDDIAIFYKEGNKMAVHMVLSDGGKFNYQPYWWSDTPGSGTPISWFNLDNIKYVVPGSFDNDSHADDIAIFYNESGNTAVHMIKSDGTKFNYQSYWWADPPGSNNPISWLSLNNIKHVLPGNFDNQSKDDIAMLYDEDGKTAIHMIKSDGSKFNYKSYWWADPPGSNNPITWFNLNNVKKVVTGNFDNDLYSDDIAMFYDESGSTAVHAVKSNGANFIYDSYWWADPPGSNNPITWFNLNNVMTVSTGDYDGDKKIDDVAILYNESGNPAIHMLASNNSDFIYSSSWWDFSTYVNNTTCPGCCLPSTARANDTESIQIISEINESGSMDLSIYPNPSSNTFYIVGNNVSEYRFYLTDVTGRAMEVETIIENDSKVKINCSAIRSGTYILNAQGEKKNVFKRIIIKE